MIVKHTTKRTGPTMAQVNEMVVDEFVAAVLADHRATPDQFAGTARDKKTPFHDTGTLIKGFFFKRASASAKRTGLIGTIRAPASRFSNPAVRDRFTVYLWKLWDTRGVGWSVGGI